MNDLQNIDWTEKTSDIAQKLNTGSREVSYMRAVYAPKTVRKTKSSINWEKADFNSSIDDIMKATGACKSTIVGVRKYALQKAKYEANASKQSIKRGDESLRGEELVKFYKSDRASLLKDLRTLKAKKTKCKKKCCIGVNPCYCHKSLNLSIKKNKLALDFFKEVESLGFLEETEATKIKNTFLLRGYRIQTTSRKIKKGSSFVVFSKFKDVADRFIVNNEDISKSTENTKTPNKRVQRNNYRRPLKLSSTMNFGKYEGLSVVEILKFDEGYFLWLDRNTSIEVSECLIGECLKVIENKAKHSRRVAKKIEEEEFETLKKEAKAKALVKFEALTEDKQKTKVREELSNVVEADPAGKKEKSSWIVKIKNKFQKK